MSKYVIEKGIPMPAKHGAVNKYPFPDMEVGDSFFIDDSTPKNSAFRITHHWSKKLGRKFTGRTVEGGVRVWRVE